jgi:hypothetical protein
VEVVTTAHLQDFLVFQVALVAVVVFQKTGLLLAVALELAGKVMLGRLVETEVARVPIRALAEVVVPEQWVALVLALLAVLGVLG